ncbi:MAG: hypothetical protein K2X93_09450 [Candidatus Obscuribacterales bacterium]|nr:hypothetical protein [Candidatus Obscuribacterales bacterium]
MDVISDPTREFEELQQTMHPFWIQKIEEARRTSVIQFWTVAFLVIVLPILLVMKSDGYMILGVGCFIAAFLRFYWTSETMADRMSKAESTPKPVETSPIMQVTPDQSGMPSFASSHPQSLATGQTAFAQLGKPHNSNTDGVPSEPPELSGPVAADSFFTSSIEPGQPLTPQRAQTKPKTTVEASAEAPPAPTLVPVGSDSGKPRHFHDFAS